jgi:hypothetical protein
MESSKKIPSLVTLKIRDNWYQKLDMINIIIVLKAALDSHVVYYENGSNDGTPAGTDEGNARKDGPSPRKDKSEDGRQSRKDGCLARIDGLLKRDDGLHRNPQKRWRT